MLVDDNVGCAMAFCVNRLIIGVLQGAIASVVATSETENGVLVAVNLARLWKVELGQFHFVWSGRVFELGHNPALQEHRVIL